MWWAAAVGRRLSRRCVPVCPAQRLCSGAEIEESGPVSEQSSLPGLQENVPLGPRTTLGLGGRARYFIEVSEVESLSRAHEWAESRGVPILLLAGGSNMVVSDEGFDGLVIEMQLRGVEVLSQNGSVRVRVGAGEVWDEFVRTAVEKGWAGVECLSGIPGSVGATPIQNVGAYGQEVAETIREVEVWDRAEKRVIVFTAEECGFAYRMSRFKGTDAGRYVVLAVTFELTPGGSPALRYPELQRKVAEIVGHDEPGLDVVREVVLAIRRGKGMVVDSSDPDSRSAGSFFMNPVVSLQEAEDVRGRAREAGVLREDEEMPAFPSGDGKVKLSAAWLIERSGFRKGETHGGVGISGKHTLALVNRGGTSTELLALVRRIQSRVRERFGVEIHPEPNLIGFDDES